MDKDAKHEADQEPEPDLLEVWMGESEKDAEAFRSSPRHRFVMVLLAAAAVVLCVVLAKYAADVLTILLVMALAVIVLRAIESFLVETSFFTIGTLGILALGAFLFAYTFLTPSGATRALTRYLPAPVIAFLDWSESHGWARTVLVHQLGPAEASSEPGSTPAPGAASPAPSSTAAPAISSSVTLTASPSSSTLGAPVYLTARLSAPAGESGSTASVRFRDGLIVIGAADVRQEGRFRVATLTVRGLGEGRHELTAELVGTLGFASITSEPVVHVVVASKR
jgi:hypothetical protein